jgi:methionyl-tRNA formyltransferase
MILQKSTPIGSDQTAGEVLELLARIGAGLVVESCDLIGRGEAPRQKQDDKSATYAPKLSKEDGWLRWDLPAPEIHNLSRGLTPWPGARVIFGGDPVRVHRTSPGAEAEAAPGTVIAIDSGKGILVSCGIGSLWLVELQAQGRKAVRGGDFARGYRIKVGDRFESRAEQDPQG